MTNVTAYRDLLQVAEAELFRNLSDPITWPLSASFSAKSSDPGLAHSELGQTSWMLAREVRRDHWRSAEEHRRAALELRRLAQLEQDAEKRAKLESAAVVKEALAATSEALLRESVDNEPTAHERRRECLRELLEVQAELLRLKVRRVAPVSPETPEELDEQIATAELRLNRLRHEDETLRTEEVQVAAKAKADWAALDHAKMLLAEEDGRARFRRLEPDIRSRLCTQWRACEKVKRYEDEAALSMAVGDVLMSLSSTLPVATVAVLIVKMGVKKFCNCPA